MPDKLAAGRSDLRAIDDCPTGLVLATQFFVDVNGEDIGCTPGRLPGSLLLLAFGFADRTCARHPKNQSLDGF